MDFDLYPPPSPSRKLLAGFERGSWTSRLKQVRCIIHLRMSVSLLSTKLYIPPSRPNAIARPRLTEKLLSGVNQPGRFTLLSGPAGFGKTTLLSEFVARLQLPVAWVSLDEGDNDPVRFWSYLIAACQTVQAGVGASAQTMLQSPQPLPEEMIPTILINDIASLDRELVLILDDYHAIQNETIQAAFSFLLEHLPEKLHIVVSTRVDPPWPLTRFRARNQLTEIRAQDLRFSFEEAAEFLNRTMGLNLSAEDVAALEERTEGWVAGLQLAALSMQGRSDLATFVKAFTGSHIYVAEYLVEEVLRRQPGQMQTFLLQTSILDRLSAGLCDSVTRRQDGQDIMTTLHKSNLFVIPLDDEGQWFRYHHLFSDLLKARLQQSQTAQAIAELHQRAAAWYEQEEMTPEAIEHALAAADYSHVVQLIGKVALPMILQAYVRTVEGWLQAIPQDYIEESLQANMAFAWLHLLRGAFAQATSYIDRLAELFSVPDAINQDPSVQGEWLAIQSKLLNVQGRPAESRDLANRALQILPKSDTHVRSMVLVNLATAYGQMLDYDHAIETFELMVQDARAAGDYTIEILGTAGQGQMLVQQGRLHRAFEIATQGIERMEITGKTTPFSATLYGELGQICYHWHQLEQSQKYFLRSIQKSGHSGYSDPEIYRHIIFSRMSQMAGDWDAAAQEMQKASDLAHRIPPAMIREEVISQQVRVDLVSGSLTAAQEILRPEGFSFDGEIRFPDLPPGANVPHTTGLLYNSALRLLLYEARVRGDLEDLKGGIDLATRVLAGELQCRHIPIALETLLIRSQMHAVLGDDALEDEALASERNSLADVAKALELAEPEGFISIFVEEGTPIAEALTILLKRNLPWNGSFGLRPRNPGCFSQKTIIQGTVQRSDYFEFANY